MNNLHGKRILFVAPIFFDYEKDIQREIEERGGTVTFVEDSAEPYYKRWVNIMFLRYFSKRKENKQRQIFSEIYDILFLIKGAFILPQYLELFKAHNPEAESVMYQYDSLANTLNVKELFPFFNRIYSFDNVDCENEKKYNIKFLPLFFTDRLCSIPPIKYDIAIIGTYYKTRYETICKLMSRFAANRKFKIFLYYPFLSVIKQITQFSIKALLSIKFHKLSRMQVNNIMKQSRIILDIPADNQKGLTIRTFETLSFKKKLITTNREICKYNFYHKNNIYILSENDDMNALADFMEIPMMPISELILRQYHVSTFCQVIFGQEQYQYFK